MKTMRALSVVLLLAFLMAVIYAQDNSGQNPPAQQGTDQPGMDQQRPMGRMNPQMREQMKNAAPPPPLKKSPPPAKKQKIKTK